MDLDLMDYEEFDEGEEEVEEGEGQNRLFIIAVAVMSGILLIGIIAFCVWVLVVGGFIGGGGDEIVEGTETPAAMAEAALTGTAIAEVESSETAEAESAALTTEAQVATETAEAPTATIEATTPPTPAPTDAPTPIPEENGEDGENEGEGAEEGEGENGEGEATEESTGADPEGTPADVGEVTPTMGPRPSPTTTGSDTPTAVSDTGIGAFTAVIVVGALLLLLIGARKLRTAR